MKGLDGVLMLVHYLHGAAVKIGRIVWESICETVRALLTWLVILAGVLVLIAAIMFFIWLNSE